MTDATPIPARAPAAAPHAPLPGATSPRGPASPAGTAPRLSARGLVKRFGPTTALAGVDLDVAPGESVAVMGPSGSGKSTLLHCLAGILVPDSGSVLLSGRGLHDLDERQRSLVRRRQYGFVFQFGQLLAELPAVENVALAPMLLGTSRKEATALAARWLASLGLAGMEGRRPGELSGGQAQRVAVARALVTGPEVVFADEPTGALDQATGHEVMRVLTETTRLAGASLVLVTHDADVAAWCDRRVEVRDGRVVADERRAGGRDSALTTGLAVAAFAVMTALTLSVVGGLLGFQGRAAHPRGAYERENAESYVILAWTAVVLLVVPLLTLGGSAARLGVARRDARLATLRLLGVTPREVVALTVVETGGQGLVGTLAGIAGYVVLLPVWARVPFQGRTFGVAELWVGWPVLVAACAVVPLLAVVSGVVSLRRVVVSPLGVARRQTPPAVRAVRAVLAVAGMGLFMVVSASLGALGAAAIAFGIGSLAVGFAALNLIGPWTLGLVGRWNARRARTPAQLLAARRLVDDPRAVWRVVGGLGLAGFVAGALAVVPVLVSSGAGEGATPEQVAATATYTGDLARGALLTLVITFLVAAASAGITQAATVLDRRREYALQVLAGTPVELLDSVRRREVLVPMLLVGVGSAVAAVVMLSPVLGVAGVTDPRGLLLLLGCLAGGCALVLGATETSRPLLRSVLAETQVRPG